MQNSVTPKGVEMNRRQAVGVVVASIIGAAVLNAADRHVGTWQLNESGSEPGAPNIRIKIESVNDDSYKFVMTQRLPDGRTTTSEYVRHFDGKPHPDVKDSSRTRLFERIDDRTLRMTLRGADGKIQSIQTYTVGSDGKTLTLEYSAGDVKHIAVVT